MITKHVKNTPKILKNAPKRQKIRQYYVKYTSKKLKTEMYVKTSKTSEMCTKHQNKTAKIHPNVKI